MLTPEQRAGAVVEQLDRIARDYDHYEYGLPSCDPHRQECVDVVVAAINGAVAESELLSRKSEGPLFDRVVEALRWFMHPDVPIGSDPEYLRRFREKIIPILAEVDAAKGAGS